MTKSDVVPQIMHGSCLCPLAFMPKDAKAKFDEILDDFAAGRIVAPADGSQAESLKAFFKAYVGIRAVSYDPTPKAVERFFVDFGNQE